MDAAAPGGVAIFASLLNRQERGGFQISLSGLDSLSADCGAFRELLMSAQWLTAGPFASTLREIITPFDIDLVAR
jgi:hypothetical protein